MKYRCATVLPLAFFIPACLGQTPFEYADQRTHQVTYEDCLGVNDGWVVAGFIGEQTGTEGYTAITNFSLNGSPLWTTDLGWIYPQALAPGPDGSIYVTGTVDGCNGGPTGLSSVARIETDGSLTWQQEFAFSYSAGIAVSQSGIAAIFRVDAVLMISSSGDSLTSYWSGDGGIVDLAWENDSIILILSAHSIERRHWSGALIDSEYLDISMKRLLPWQGGCVTLSQPGNLFIWDQTLDLLTSFDPGPHECTAQLEAEGGIIWALGSNWAYKFDSTLSPIGELDLDADGEFSETAPFEDYSVANGMVAMSCSAPEHSRYTGLIRTVGYNGEHSLPQPNVAIRSTGIDSLWYEVAWSSPPVVTVHTNLGVMITNSGSDTLLSLSIDYTPYEWICSLQGDMRTYLFDGVAPGDSIAVGFDGLQLGPDAAVEDVWERSFCLLALSPNNLYDRDQSDNLACDTVQIVLGLDDRAVGTNDLIIANPFSGALDMTFVTPSQEPLHATLFDATGRQLATTTIAAGSKHFQWDLPGLCDGMHILRLEDRSTTTTRKLIHQQP